MKTRFQTFAFTKCNLYRRYTQAMRMLQHAIHMWRGGGPDLFDQKSIRIEGEGEGI
jgi:hypothetical protein